MSSPINADLSRTGIETSQCGISISLGTGIGQLGGRSIIFQADYPTTVADSLSSEEISFFLDSYYCALRDIPPEEERLVTSASLESESSDTYFLQQLSECDQCLSNPPRSESDYYLQDHIYSQLVPEDLRAALETIAECL